MLTMRSNNGLTREHDRQVRLHSVRTDLELDLPPRIHLPDGEEYPYGSMAKLHLRNSDQVLAFTQHRLPPIFYRVTATARFIAASSCSRAYAYIYVFVQLP